MIVSQQTIKYLARFLISGLTSAVAAMREFRVATTGSRAWKERRSDHQMFFIPDLSRAE
jgi:hypothetical protein